MVEYLDIAREDKSWTIFVSQNLLYRVNPMMSALDKTHILIAGGKNNVNAVVFST